MTLIEESVAWGHTDTCRELQIQRKSLARCSGFYPMTLTEERVAWGHTAPCRELQIQTQVIGTMFGFLPNDFRQRSGKRPITSDLPHDTGRDHQTHSVAFVVDPILPSCTKTKDRGRMTATRIQSSGIQRATVLKLFRLRNAATWILGPITLPKYYFRL